MASPVATVAETITQESAQSVTVDVAAQGIDRSPLSLGTDGCQYNAQGYHRRHQKGMASKIELNFTYWMQDFDGSDKYRPRMVLFLLSD